MYNSAFTGQQIDNGVSTSAVMSLCAMCNKTDVTFSIVTNAEFYCVLLDSADKIVCGLRKDMAYVGLPIDKAIAAVIPLLQTV